MTRINFKLAILISCQIDSLILENGSESNYSTEHLLAAKAEQMIVNRWRNSCRCFDFSE